VAESRKIRSAPEREVEPGRARELVSRAFTRVEDVVYIGLAVLLAGSALVLLGTSVIDFARSVLSGSLATTVVALLDQLLLVLMIVEILYTVQVSFREHALVPEPFLVVVLIAATRRVIVLIAEFADLAERGELAFRYAMVELALLIAMILAVVASLLMLRKRGPAAVADRA
jgi:hypothetical protein